MTAEALSIVDAERGIIEVPGYQSTDVISGDDLNQLLVWLTEQDGGSDLIIKSFDTPGVRVNGEWYRVDEARLLPDSVSNLLSVIYQQSAPAQIQGRGRLNFRYQVNVRRGVQYGFRVNAIGGHTNRSDLGIKITFRPIPAMPPDFDALGFEQAIRDYAMPKQGLVVISGPTGSGKTTTLASIIAHRLMTRGENIQTFEHPMEFDFESMPGLRGFIWQVEIGRHLESFSDGIAEVLRQAPDVILIGEARDRSTIEGVATASLTGHACYTTTHTNNVASTIPRMAAEFPEDARWGMAVNLIDATRVSIHQQLARRPDGGRVAIREILVFDDYVKRELFKAGEHNYVSRTRELVEECGQPLFTDVQRKYHAGHIAESEYVRLHAELGQAA